MDDMPEVAKRTAGMIVAMMDRDRDGFLTSEKVLRAVHELMIGDDPDAPGNSCSDRWGRPSGPTP
jgi:hypothetical protein